MLVLNGQSYPTAKMRAPTPRTMYLGLDIECRFPATSAYYSLIAVRIRPEPSVPLCVRIGDDVSSFASNFNILVTYCGMAMS